MEAGSLIAGTSNTNNTIATDKTKLKTNVVNVSTVFNSLNEYVNAGTDLNEKLQQVEIQPQAADSASTNGDSKPLISPSTSSISTESHTSSSPDGGGGGTKAGRRLSTSSTASNSSEAGNHHRHHKRRHSSCSSSASSTPSSASSTSTSDGEEGGDADVHERLNEGLSLSAGDYILDSSENTTLATTNEEQPVSQVAPEKKAGPSEQQDTSAFSYKNSLYSDTLSNDVINLEGWFLGWIV